MKRVPPAAILRFLILALAVTQVASRGRGETSQRMEIATFSSDITIPLGHRCMGVLPTKAVQIDDALEAH